MHVLQPSPSEAGPPLNLPLREGEVGLPFGSEQLPARVVP